MSPPFRSKIFPAIGRCKATLHLLPQTEFLAEKATKSPLLIFFLMLDPLANRGRLPGQASQQLRTNAEKKTAL
jgi:hypothetical protein